MCGIVGYYSLKQSYTTELSNALDVINYRGPDGRGAFESDDHQPHIGLGHVRLSIIDLSKESDQPFWTTDGEYCIIFNGEIYNYQSLRHKHLQGVALRTSSDTEVLLQLYIKLGESFLDEVLGMFSLCIYSKADKSLFIARDQLGIKPLYYAFDGEQLFFSSEIKSIGQFDQKLTKIDKNCLYEFLLNGFLYEPDTGFKHIKKLPPGHWIKLDKNMQFELQRYWIPTARGQADQNINWAKEIESSIKSHLVSDVPVGLFFSGGVDSTVLLKYVENVKPLLFKAESDEVKQAGMSSDVDYARMIGKHWNIELDEVESKESIKSTEDFLEKVESLAHMTEEPIADFTFIASLDLSKRAKQRGYKVMLSGMGADEIFAGYPRYNLVKNQKFFGLLNKLLPLPLLRLSKKFEKKAERFKTFFRYNELALSYTSTIGYFSPEETSRMLGCDQINEYKSKLDHILESFPAGISDLKKAMCLDLYGFLSHNFLVADKSSMLCSIEMRVPLATHELFEKVLSIDDNDLLDRRRSKKILKDLLAESLDKNIIERRKAGFNPPLDGYIRRLGGVKLGKVLDENGLYQYLDRAFIEQTISDHFEKNINNTYKLYQLLYLSYWLKTNKE